MPRPQSAGITTYLRHRGLTRSYGTRAGFRILPADQDNQITIDWFLGADEAALSPQERQEKARKHLYQIQQALADRYTVTEHPCDTGPAQMYLLVQEKPVIDLTRLQQKALETVREGGVVYRYEPPARPGDLRRPVFSHGLHARTVLSLERLRLVALVPLGPERGRVKAVEG